MFEKRKTLQLFLALLLGSPWVFAQGQGSLVGTVRDPSGGVIPGAQVVATRVETGLPYQTTTNESGDYIFSALPVGTYAVSFTAKGFQEAKVEKIEMHVSETVRQDGALQVQTAATTLEVTAATPMVKSETAEIGTLVAGQQISELPLNGRDPFQLLKLAPGAETQTGAQVSEFVNQTMPTLAGGRAGFTGFRIDGVDVESENVPGVGVDPMLDTTEEFRTITTLSPAQYGFMSVITLATKSGTNSFHGTAYDFLRNNVLDVHPFFQHLIETPAFSTPPAQLRYNQFGGTIGGPIVKNRTFFFGGVELLRQKSSGQSTYLMPTTASVGGDFSGENPVSLQPFLPVIDPQTGLQFPGNVIPPARISSTAQPVSAEMAQAFFVAPNCPACLASGLGFNYVGSAPSVNTYNKYQARVDHRISERDNLFTSFQYGPLNSTLVASSVPSMGAAIPVTAGNYVVGWSHVIRPTLLNEVRINFLRNYSFVEQTANAPKGEYQFGNTPFAPPNSGLFPMVAVDGYSLFGSQLFSQKIHIGEEHWGYLDNLTWMKGNHQFKFGFEGMRDHFYVKNTLNAFFIYEDGFQSFPGFTGNGLADFLLGNPIEAITYQGAGRAVLVERDRLDTYAQDDWKVSSRLTLNLGLRWDYLQRWHDADGNHNRLGTIDLSPAGLAMGGRYLMAGSPDYFLTGVGIVQGTGAPLVGKSIIEPEYTDFQPRIGLAYRPFNNNSTAIRAGYGLYFMESWAKGVSFTETTPPFEYQVTQYNFLTTPPINVSSPQMFPDLSLQGSGGMGDFIHNRDSRVQEWTLSIEHQLKNSVLLSAEYLGNHGQKGLYSEMINEPPLPNATQLLQLEANPALNTSLAMARLPMPNIALGYGLNVNDADSWYEALNIKAEGRFRQRMNFTAVYTWSKALDEASEENTLAAASVYNLRLNKSYAEFDHPNRFVSSAVYDLPLGETYLVPQNAGLKKLVAGWEVTGIATFEAGPPYTVGLGIDSSFRGGLGNTFPTMTGPAVYSNIRATNGIYMTPQNFGAPPFGSLSGMIPRNDFHGPGVNNFDIGLIKNTAVTETVKLQFRAEFFNAFNHAQFQVGNQSVAYGMLAPPAGSPPGTPPTVQWTPASSFGRAGALPGRIIQFGLKLLF